MKRDLLILLVVLSLLCGILSSCIVIAPNDAPNKEDPTKETPDPSIKSPAWTDAAQTASDFYTAAGGIVDLSKREYSWGDMKADLIALAEKFPNEFSYYQYGQSVAGRALLAGVLGNPNASKQVIVSAALHGREYLNALLTMKQLEFYLTYYHTGDYNGTPYKTLFENCCFYIMPMSNPDGVMLSQKGISTVQNVELSSAISSIYRSDFTAGMTSQKKIDDYLQYWKANANGVDLNRNFDAKWEEYHNYSKPSFALYKGDRPASEPETQAMVQLTESLSNVVAVLCIHSQGEVIYWNCGQEEALFHKTLAFARVISERNGYTVKEEQNNDASYSDWCALNKGLIAVTVETGIGMCPLDLEKLDQIWDDNYDLWALCAEYFLWR